MSINHQLPITGARVYFTKPHFKIAILPLPYTTPQHSLGKVSFARPVPFLTATNQTSIKQKRRPYSRLRPPRRRLLLKQGRGQGARLGTRALDTASLASRGPAPQGPPGSAFPCPPWLSPASIKQRCPPLPLYIPSRPTSPLEKLQPKFRGISTHQKSPKTKAVPQL